MWEWGWIVAKISENKFMLYYLKLIDLINLYLKLIFKINLKFMLYYLKLILINFCYL